MFTLGSASRSGSVLGTLVVCLGLGACAMIEVPARGTSETSRGGPVALSGVFGQPVPRPQPETETAAAAGIPVGVRTLAPPVATEHHSVVVEPGDTVSSIARRTGVSTEDLVRANGLSPPFALLVGQRLTIPRPTDHVVRQGETVYTIAERYAIDVPTLASANGLTQPYQVVSGQVLSIPGRDVGKQTDSGPSPAVAAVPAPRPPEPLPEPPRASRGGFVWPLEGKLLSRFGPKTNGLHNDGINIGAAVGTDVKAAQSGVVAYAGNQLQGFGNMLLIKHESGWITAYAHADELLVRRGDRVSRGQVIARVGSSGGVNQPQLHFELRKGKKAVDPLKHLPPLGA